MDQIIDRLMTALRWSLRGGYLVAALFGLFLLASWGLDNDDVINIKPGRALHASLHAGETQTIIQPLQKFSSCPGHVVRSLVGDCGIFEVMDSEAILPRGYNGELRISFTVPPSALPGSCSLLAVHRYYCSPVDWAFNRKVYAFPPVEFEVIP